MTRVGPYLFKFADAADEVDQVHRLNYRTFVREIPQHADPGTGRLVDKFHHKNTYVIAVRDGRVVGMLAIHGTPPFSVAGRLPDPAVLSAPGVRPLEVRLLAVEPEDRSGPAMVGMCWHMLDFAREHGHTHLIVSGVESQKALYAHMGFQPLGPPVGSGEATFTPMWVPLGELHETLSRLIRLWGRRVERRAPGAGGHEPTPNGGTTP